MTKEELRAFEQEIHDLFAEGKIKAPIHLSGGNEDELIEVFQSIGPHDWVLGTWRSHYHCLLKGVPPEELEAKILDGHSVGLCFPEHNILCSGIVGGIAPIAIGIAWSLKRRNAENLNGNQDTRVHVFLGDMSAMSGIVQECVRYAGGHSLPIRWIIEDNELSVCTDTRAVWGPPGPIETIHYKYKLSWPHSGIAKWVQF